MVFHFLFNCIDAGKLVLPTPLNENGFWKNFQKITERFQRNVEIDANEDVAERVFALSEDKVQVTYHRHDGNISASTRDFFKPPNAEEKGGNLQWSPEMTTTFQVYFNKLTEF